VLRAKVNIPVQRWRRLRYSSQYQIGAYRRLPQCRIFFGKLISLETNGRSRDGASDTNEPDIEFTAGKFTVSGTDRSMTSGEIAGAAYFPPDGFPLDMRTTQNYRSPPMRWPSR